MKPGLSRMASGSPFADQGFAYDNGYNRSSWTLGGATTSYAVNNLNQYTMVSTAEPPAWNTDGGLAAFAGNTYTYDAMQRLTEVDYSGGKTLFSYDPLGRRVKKVDENTSGTVLATYQYHYDGSAVAVEYQPSTTWTYFGGTMRTDGTNKQWYYGDALGSVSAVADNSGDLLEAYEYNAQGQFQITNGGGTVLSTTGINNDRLYAGYHYDAETGNYFCNARYYSPVLGRFISRDPLSGAEFSQGTNLYAYCANNPICLTDPSGLCPMDDPPNVFDGQNYGPGNPDNPTLDNPWPSGINPYDQALDPTAIGNAQSLALSGNRNGGSPTSPYISHYGGPWDPDQDGAGTFMGGSNATIPTGNHDNPLNGNSLAISSNVAKANGLHVGGPVYVNGTYLGNYDDTAPENNTIDVYDPGNVVNNSNWGGTVPGGSTITTH